MKSISKIILILSGLSLLMATNAVAFPLKGETVRMEDDWKVPYTMKDLSDGTVYASFCLESEIHFKPGNNYNVDSVGDFAESGGGGAINGRDEVSAETKWLYAAYMSKVFTSIDAQTVQNAIWFLEEEDDGVENDWNLLRRYDFDDTGWTVVAVNLTLNGKDKQSQLIGTTKVPEPGTMLFLGAGLISLAGFGRRKLLK